MRKLVSAALAGVFMSSSGFATLNTNDLVVEDFGTCEDACIAYADHIDMNDGYNDRDLIRWNRDRRTCEARMCASIEPAN
ncbi:hypothetical protein [Nonlabens sp.]|uniref:hypothetical protein n=1 Tax=Nonlabens sp. TaxID=1888209 RepID=UPI0025DA43B0|nr:hypothetical protein [Nonlabens sp.]